MRAIVTGGSSGIGRAIAEMLACRGDEVYAVGQTFEAEEETEGIRFVKADLLAEGAVEAVLRETGKEVDLLVNCAGCAYYGLHETMSPEKIRKMVRLNLEIPMIFCAGLMRQIRERRGMIINISSVTALSSSPHAAAYGATKAGLLSFGRSLFDEGRKHGVRVTTLLPDMTRTQLYRNADFTVSDDPGCALTPEDVASAVAYVLDQPEGVAVPELMLRPQLHRIRKKQHP